MLLACINGHLNVVQWLVTNFNLTADDVRANNNWALQYSCASNHKAVAQWLIDRFQLPVEEIKQHDPSNKFNLYL